MKVLIDIAHPAHIHYFKNFSKIFEEKGHECLFTLRDKGIIIELAEHYKLNFKIRSKENSNKLYYACSSIRNIYSYAKIFKPDLFLDMGTVFAAPVAKFLGKPYIAFDDTEVSKISRLFHMPFTDVILTPSCFWINLGRKQIFFNSYMELNYLRPKYFTPDPSIYSELGLNNGQKFVILRFVSWAAHHDKGHKGLTLVNKRDAVHKFLKYAKVFISSEKNLPPDLKQFEMKIQPHRMHDAIFYASLLYGESATMSSEAAVCGTPSIYIDNIGRGYTKEQETKYNLVFNYTESESDQNKSIEKGVEILKSIYIKKEGQNSRQKLLIDKIDITEFLVWFVQNYPQSYKIIKKDPEYQLRFK